MRKEHDIEAEIRWLRRQVRTLQAGLVALTALCVTVL